MAQLYSQIPYITARIPTEYKYQLPMDKLVFTAPNVPTVNENANMVEIQEEEFVQDSLWDKLIYTIKQNKTVVAVGATGILGLLVFKYFKK